MTPEEEIQKLKDDLKVAEDAKKKIEADLATQTKATEKAVADKKKILEEKKTLMDKMFSDDEKAEMTDTEKKLAEELEKSRADLLSEKEAREKLEGSMKEDADSRNKAENDRVSKALESRIVKAAKGDKTIEDNLRANVALLDKLPRSSDEDFDNIVNKGFNMMGTPEANPLNSASTAAGGDAAIDKKPGFASTPEGKNLAGKIGLTYVANEGKDEAKPADPAPAATK